MAYFDRVDVYEIEADLRVTNRAAEEGRRTQTAGSDAEIHDTQREIMGAIGERRNLARTSAEGTLKDIDVKLGDIDLGASHSLRSLGHLTRSSFELVLGRLRSVIAGVGCAPMTKRLLRLTFCGAPHLTGSCYLVAAKSSTSSKSRGSPANPLILLVPLAGLEPARPCGQQILSPTEGNSGRFFGCINALKCWGLEGFGGWRLASVHRNVLQFSRHDYTGITLFAAAPSSRERASVL